MAKVTLEDVYNIVINMQNNMNTMQNNMNTMQNTLLSMKDDIHRLDKKIDGVEERLTKEINDVKTEVKEIKDFVEHEFETLGDNLDKTIKETMKPYTNEIENIVTFLEPQGYVSVREKSTKYDV